MSLILIYWTAAGCDSAKTTEVQIAPRELTTETEQISFVRFSPDGKQLAAGGANGQVLLWRDFSGPTLRLESGRVSPLVSLTWSFDGLLSATDLDRGFMGWQFDKGDPRRVDFPQLPSPGVCLAFRKASALELVLGMRDGSLIFLDASGSKQLKPEHRGAVKQIAYSADGKWIISAGADGQLIWRDVTTRKAIQAVKAHDSEISRLLLHTDGKQFVTGDWNGRIKVWDTSTRKSDREFNQPEAVSGLGWVGNELISGSWDGFLREWQLPSGHCNRTIPTGSPIHDLAADRETRRVATVDLGQSVKLWEWPDSKSQ